MKLTDAPTLWNHKNGCHLFSSCLAHTGCFLIFTQSEAFPWNTTRVSWSALFTAFRPLVLRAGHQITVNISSEWWKISTLQRRVCKENSQILQLNDELFNAYWWSCNICFPTFLITIVLSSRQTRECGQNMQECDEFVCRSHEHLEKMTRKISELIIISINPLVLFFCWCW